MPSCAFPYAAHSFAPFAVVVATATTVLVAFFTTVVVPGSAVTVVVVTPWPCVIVLNFVDVLTGNVVLIVLVTSEDLVMYTVCWAATMVCVVVLVSKLLIVTASAVTVESEVVVAKLVENRVVWRV